MQYIKYFILIVYSALAFHGASGQANYWATYPGEGDHPAFYKYKINCNEMPPPDVTTSGAFTTLPHEVFDSLSNNYQIEGVNTVFDPDGNPLFAVDVHGIYNVTTKSTSWCCPMITNRIYPFSSLYSAACPAISEIEIFPVPYECNLYHILYWARECDNRTGDYIALLQVVVNTSASTPTIDSVTILEQMPYVDGIYGLVADAVRTGGKREVYALYPNGSGNLHIDKLVFNEDGSYLSMSLLTPPLPEAGSRIFELTADGTIAYISSDRLSLKTYNVHTATLTTYTPSRGEIRGLEYVPTRNYWYISYFLPPTPFFKQGGIGYFDLNVSPVSYTELSVAPPTVFPGTGFKVPNMGYCNATDLELSKSGYLYLLANDDTFGTYGYFRWWGDLAYINTNDPVKAVQGPIFAYTAGNSTGIPIQSKTTIDNGLPGCCYGGTGWDNARSFYLGNQIDFEDYNGYFRPTSDEHGFTINHQPPSFYQSNPCPSSTESFQDICFGSPIEYEFTPRISSDESIGMIHWDEIDDCGNVVHGGVSGHSANIHWLGPFDVLDIAKVPKGAGMQLDNPAIIGKKLLVYFDAISSCTSEDHYFLANIRLVPSHPISNVQVTIDASGTAYTPLGTSCTTAPGACGVNPYIRFSQTGLSTYWMVIKDYGLSCNTPTLVGAGVGSPTPVSSTSPPDIIESLPQYLWQYCGYSSLAAATNYFVTHPSHIYGVKVFGNNTCGVDSLEGFFVGGLGCKMGSTGTNNIDAESEIKIYPNPANDYLKIDCSKETIGAVYDVKEIAGKQLLHGNINISGQSISIDALSSGIYIFEISKQDKIIKKLRFTKQ